ncbi:MAG: hypothetical protein AAF265_14105, partial [Pseudomonadota bacterium]
HGSPVELISAVRKEQGGNASALSPFFVLRRLLANYGQRQPIDPAASTPRFRELGHQRKRPFHRR